MGKRVADVLIETLQAAGVKNCYGIVGDTMNQIAHSIDRSEIDFVHVRHEEAGAFAAAADALLTGNLTACAGKPALYQRPLRGQPQSSVGRPHCHPDRTRRYRIPEHSRSRPCGGVQGLQRLFRDDSYA